MKKGALLDKTSWTACF